MPPFLRYVPCSGSDGLELPVTVHEITKSDVRARRCQAWHRDVQPVIARRTSRPDAAWNWPMLIQPLTLLGGLRRGGRLFQVTIGAEQKPAAMIALLSNERWFEDWSQPATFLWFLSAAPPEALSFEDARGVRIKPRQVGRTAFDVALTVALQSAGKGRLWLHADPLGGDKLMAWYRLTIGMRIIDPVRYPKLPGDAIRRTRPNDGRYLYLDEPSALQTHAALSAYRE